MQKSTKIALFQLKYYITTIGNIIHVVLCDENKLRLRL